VHLVRVRARGRVRVRARARARARVRALRLRVTLRTSLCAPVYADLSSWKRVATW